MRSVTTRAAGYILLLLVIMTDIPGKAPHSQIGHDGNVYMRSSFALVQGATTQSPEESLNDEEDSVGTEETPGDEETTVLPPSTPASTQPPAICTLECVNGECVLVGRESRCVCDDGYEEALGDTVCLDINECLNPDACDHLCFNLPGTYYCACDAGYALNATDERTCIELNECDSDPCVYGTCTDLVNSFQCTCLPGYGGVTCDIDIDECASDPCEYGTCNDFVNAYNCTCFDGYTGTNCDQDINECSSDPCLYGTCVDLVNMFRCDCTDGWTGTLCDEDVDECASSTLNNCEQNCINVNSTVDENGYICDCNDGYELNGDGLTCTEIDECDSDPCSNGGACEDLVNGFQCVCADGWEGTTCDDDIDECDRSTSDCDANADCTNTIGSYNCTCQDEYRGDGFVCREIIMFGFGSDYGDLNLRDTKEDKRSYGLFDLVSPTIKPPAGFPFWDEFYYSLYFTDNGIIVFIQENGEKYALSHPPEGGFTTSQSTPMIAVFWEDNDMRQPEYGQVYYKVYDASSSLSSVDQGVVDEINERIRTAYPNVTSPDGQFSSFSATWILKITWYQVPAFNVDYTKDSPNTFQGVLATDGRYGFVVINFMEDEMLWNYAIRETNYAIIGYNSGKGDADQIKNAQDQFSTLGQLYRPDQYAGNTGEQGRWIFRVEDNDASTVNEKGECLSWYVNQPDPSSWDQNLGKCPCSIGQGRNDPGFGKGGRVNGEVQTDAANSADVQQQTDFSLLTSLSELPIDGTCLVTSFPNDDGAGQLCCYRDDGSLITGYDSLWSSSFQQKNQWANSADSFDSSLYIDWINDDILPRYYCCNASSDPAFCELYIEKRPASNCVGYSPPKTGFMLGDPHITTLDGTTYTFNGLGEYMLVTVDDGFFELQSRTARFNTTDGELSMATIFSAFAMKQSDSSTVQFTLSADGTDCELLVDGQTVDKSVISEDLVTSSNWQNVAFYSQLEEATNVTRTVAVFSSGIGVSVAIGEAMLDAVFGAPDSYKNKTKGLLGVWNDETDDDFELPSGALQQSTVSGQPLTDADYFDFGQAWQIAEGDSLFTYAAPASWDTYNNNTFVPLFLDQVIANSDSAFVTQARSTCGNDDQCLFDTLATGNEVIGQATKSTTEQFQFDAVNLANFPPSIIADFTINATVGEETVIDVSATDPDGDAIVFSLDTSSQFNGSITANGTFTWIPTSLTPVTVGYAASDGLATSVLVPVVRLCACQNGGVCNFDEQVDGSDSVDDKFNVVPCTCSPAYTGDFCEEDYNGCLDEPCYPGVLCYDRVAPQIGADCLACPSGLVGNGYKCFDFDECTEGRDFFNGTFCDQICTNTFASYVCSCNSGYELHPDQKQCTDIDECAINTHDCDTWATCDNTPGGYTCTCLQGFDDVNGDGTQCDNIDECVVEAPCDDNADCDDTVGSYVCTCVIGFEGNGLVCTNIDECVTLQDDCDIRATCTDTIGSYTCQCDAGWQGDGRNCTNVDECQDANLNRCSPKATCTDVQGSYSCACNNGYVGNGITCNDIDECQTNQDNCADDIATCTNTQGSFTCDCNTGYSGDGVTCEDVNECIGTTTVCSTYANCTNTAGSYFCECFEGFIGNGIVCADNDECESPTLNDCDPDNGLCLNSLGAYQCRCQNGYQGDGTNCTDVNECLDNFGGCEHQLCENTVGGFECSCDPGYLLNQDGLTCSVINQCNLGTDDCPQGCANGTATQYSCYCYEGFEDDGQGGCQPITNCSKACTNGVCYVLNSVELCQCDRGYKFADGNDTVCEDIDESTDPNYPHRCEQIVTNTVPGYNCSCNEGFQLNVDERTCSDKNECEGQTNVCSDRDHTHCVNRFGGYECVCDTGFYNVSDVCYDINECEGAHGCSVFGYCNNTVGSYICRCNDGYTGTGFICADTNECLDPTSCDIYADCVNTEGSYNCSCYPGFRGDGLNCTDINECREDLHGCDADATCSNNPGSYLCTCNSGFQGDGKACFDVNECTLPGNDPRKADCDDLASCNNTYGSYECTCLDGYEGNGTRCTDINECASADTNTCDERSRCENIERSYLCICLDGYRAEDRDSCVDIDECAENPTICGENADCTNSPGTYTCTCISGFTGNGTYCEDIDECSSDDLNNCDPVADCMNFPGSYACSCPSGYLEVNSTAGILCEDFNECLFEQDNCDDSFGICRNIAGGFICECIDGYSGTGVTCTDIDECKTRPCDYNNNERCVNTPGNYTCECLSGYERVNGTCQAVETLEGSVVYEGSDGFRWVYTSDLTTTGSVLFQSYSSIVIRDMLAVFSNSSLADDYVGSIVVSMEDYNTYIKVTFILSFHPGSNVQEDDVEAAYYASLTGRVNDIVNVLSHILPGTFVIGEPVINPCFDGTDDCDPLATCVFLGNNNYTCICDDGYAGNGTIGNCRDINECENGVCNTTNLECVNTVGSYICQCSEGYIQLESSNNTCVDRKAFKFTTEMTADDGTALTYTDSLADTSSNQYTTLSNNVRESVEYVIKRSSGLKDTYYGVGDITFSDGSIFVDIDIYFAADSPVVSQDVVDAIEALDTGSGLATVNNGEVTATFLIRTFKVYDYDICSLCSPNATCSSSNGTLECQCDEGFLDTSVGEPGTICTEPPTTAAIVTTVAPPTAATPATTVVTTKTAVPTTTEAPATSLAPATSVAAVSTVAPTTVVVTATTEDICYPDYCLNDGECYVDNNGERQCRCPSGFEGERCSVTSDDDTNFIQVLAIIGGVVGGILLVIVIVFTMYCCAVCGRQKEVRREGLFIRNQYVGKYPEGFRRDSEGSDEIAWETVSSGQSSTGRPDDIEEMERMNTLASVMEHAPMIDERMRERLRRFDDRRGIRSAAALPQRSEFFTPYVVTGAEASERERQRRAASSRRGYRGSRRRDEGVLIPRARNETNPTHHVPFSQLRDSSSGGNSETQTVSDFSMY